MLEVTSAPPGKLIAFSAVNVSKLQLLTPTNLIVMLRPILHFCSLFAAIVTRFLKVVWNSACNKNVFSYKHKIN